VPKPPRTQPLRRLPLKLVLAKIRFAVREIGALCVSCDRTVSNTDTKHHYVVNKLLFRLLAAIFLACPGLARAQSVCPVDPSDPNAGAFNVSATKVCLGSSVTVSGVPANLGNVGYFYNYTGNGLPTTAPTASPNSPSYSSPGAYTILQIGSRNGNGTRFCRVVEVVASDTQPAISLKVCGNTATLSYTLTGNATKYDELFVTWGDGSSNIIPVTPATLTGFTTRDYTARTAPYPISLTGRVRTTPICSGPQATTSAVVAPMGAGNPVFLQMNSSANSISMEYSVPAGLNIEVLRKDPGAAGYVSTGITNPPNPFTVAAPSDKSTCFQIAARDACGTTERRSPETCSLVLNVEAGDKRNTVRWALYGGEAPVFSGYRVFKDGTRISPSLPLSTLQYIDNNNIQCGQRYCYQLEARPQYPAGFPGPTVIRSAEACVSGVDKSTIAGPTSMYVSVQGNNDEVYMKSVLPTPPPASYTLVVERANAFAGPFTQVGTNEKDASYTDTPTQSDRQSYCYRTAIQNNCGVTSAFTPPACTILLTQDPDGKLRWSDGSPFSDAKPTRLTLVPIDAITGQPVADPSTGAIQAIDITNLKDFDPKTLSNQQTRYQITAEGPTADSYSNTVDVSLLMRLFVPNAFSPNGDRDNNTFMAKGDFWDQFEMTLYDRWGTAVFNTTARDSTGWDGTIGGAPAAEGYYTYRIKITDVKGNAFERTGRVLLLR
jgi:gliding motility-associated-like protein